MKAERIILSLVVITALLAMLLTTSFGYAVETNNIIKISDNPVLLSEQSNFKIAFVGKPSYSGEGKTELKINGNSTANINVTGLKKVGDSATAIVTIENKSKELHANVYTKVTNTNTEYFKVTATLADNVLEPKNGQTTLRITVKLIKQPIEKVKTDISIKVIANPSNV